MCNYTGTECTLRGKKTLPVLIKLASLHRAMACPNKKAGMQQKDNLADSLNDLFTSVSNMVKSELQGTNNQLELLEKMNARVSEEYKGFGDVASGLRVNVEQLKGKSGNFEEYVHQIEEIEKQVTEFEAVISVLDKYVSLLESKVKFVYHQNQHPHQHQHQHQHQHPTS